MTASEHSGEHARLPPAGARSWYDVLDIGRDADAKAIEAAYDRAIALIEGESVGAYMVLDPDAKASAKSDVETAFLVLSDPGMRAAFDASMGEGDDKASRDEALAAAQLLDEEEWIASGPPSPGSTPPRSAGADSGPTPAASAANDDQEDEDRQRASEAETAPPSNAASASATGGPLRFLAPVYDDTSGPVAASARTDEEADDVGDLPPAAPSLTIAPPVEAVPEAPSSLEQMATGEDERETPQAAERSAAQVAGPAEAVRGPAAPSAAETASVSRAPAPRLTREQPLDPDVVPTAPPTSRPLVSHIQTLPPDLVEALVDGAEVNGQVIRRLRESRDLSIEEVANATHIRKAYLRAIEEMDVDELPARVYLRGFLTQIARVLKVDKKVLSDGYLSFIERFQR